MEIIKLFLIKFLLLQVGQITAKDDETKQMEIISGSLVDPCNDFHQYACGSWKQVFTEAVSKYNDTLEMLDYNVNKELADIFHRKCFAKFPLKFMRPAYKYYKSCVNLDIKEYNIKKYLMLITENDHEQTDNIWYKTLAKLRRYGLNNIFISQADYIKVDNERQVFLYLSKPNFEPLNFESLKSIFTYLGKPDNEDFYKLWLEIQDFQKKLQQLNEIEDTEVNNEEEYVITIKDLSLDWLKDYIKIILNQKDLEPQMQLYLNNKSYMKALEELLQTYNQTFLNQYLEIRFMVYLLTQEPYEFNDINCMSTTRRLMPFAMHWLYEQAHPELLEEYEKIFQIFDNVRNNFNKTMIENKYKFNTGEIEFLLSKMNKLQLRFNNLPRQDTKAALEEYYQDLNLDINNFFENHLKLQYFNFQLPIKLMYNNKGMLDDTYYIRNEHISAPYYLRDANILVLPLTLLQQPFYSTKLDDIFNYSTLGFIMTTELFRAFDVNGLTFSANGSLSSIDFEAYPLFNASLNCLLETNPEGIKKKISYASGLRYAYQTYFSLHPEAAKKSQLVNDEEMSMSKIFFLNFAQTFCSTSREPVDIDYVIDALKHFPKFTETFKCNKNQLLYAQDDCHLW